MAERRPSKWTSASRTFAVLVLPIRICTTSSEERTTDRELSVWGQIGVMTIIFAPGSTIGPPAERL